jgi:outer membrane scaffolding protein for murein synthesis (MipA/OmpV family)
LINSDLAWNHLLGNASDSPITQASVQGILEVLTEYRWLAAVDERGGKRGD